MNRATFFLFFALSFPFFTNALAQGFAPGSLWLSDTHVSTGQTLKIYAVLFNSSEVSFEGDIDFNVDGESVQTLHFKLASGESKVISTDWTATSGTHSFSAQFRNVPEGTIEGPSVTNTTTIVVATGTPSALNNYINEANNFIASKSPELASFGVKIASTSENLRQAGANWLSNGLNQSTAPESQASTSFKKTGGQVLGAETYRQPTASNAGFFASLRSWVFMLLLAIFQSPWLFYAAILITFWILWKILRAILQQRKK